MDRPSVRLVIPFSTPIEAEIAYNSLSVDKEPKINLVDKKLSVDGKNLIVDLEGADVKSLRTSTNSFFEYLLLVQKTIAKFSLKSQSQ